MKNGESWKDFDERDECSFEGQDLVPDEAPLPLQRAVEDFVAQFHLEGLEEDPRAHIEIYFQWDLTALEKKAVMACLLKRPLKSFMMCFGRTDVSRDCEDYEQDPLLISFKLQDDIDIMEEVTRRALSDLITEWLLEIPGFSSGDFSVEWFEDEMD